MFYFISMSVKSPTKLEVTSRLLERKALNQTNKRGYKTQFMLNSAEHEIYPAHKC